jgi:hypothetical protein
MNATSNLTVLHDAHFNVPLMVSDFCEAKIVSNHRAAPMQQQGSRVPRYDCFTITRDDWG